MILVKHYITFWYNGYIYLLCIFCHTSYYLGVLPVRSQIPNPVTHKGVSVRVVCLFSRKYCSTPEKKLGFHCPLSVRDLVEVTKNNTQCRLVMSLFYNALKPTCCLTPNLHLSVQPVSHRLTAIFLFSRLISRH